MSIARFGNLRPDLAMWRHCRRIRSARRPHRLANRLQVPVPPAVHKPGLWRSIFRPSALPQTAPEPPGTPFAVDVVLLGHWTLAALAGVVQPLMDEPDHHSTRGKRGAGRSRAAISM